MEEQDSFPPLRGEAGDTDIQELVEQYKIELSELMFNSKPIITNLTIIAGENSHAAEGIAQAICDHILKVPKEQKLPSLYLLDSIVKNEGGDYVKCFSRRLADVFWKVYQQVDPPIHTALHHLFQTWPSVFPPQLLRHIESRLPQLRRPPPPPAAPAPPATRQMGVPGMPARVESPGGRIHVNPKYLEAQARRQRMENPSHVGLQRASPHGWEDRPPSRVPQTAPRDSADFGGPRDSAADVKGLRRPALRPADPAKPVHSDRMARGEGWPKPSIQSRSGSGRFDEVWDGGSRAQHEDAPPRQVRPAAAPVLKKPKDEEDDDLEDWKYENTDERLQFESMSPSWQGSERESTTGPGEGANGQAWRVDAERRNQGWGREQPRERQESRENQEALKSGMQWDAGRGPHKVERKENGRLQQDPRQRPVQEMLPVGGPSFPARHMPAEDQRARHPEVPEWEWPSSNGVHLQPARKGTNVPPPQAPSAQRLQATKQPPPRPQPPQEPVSGPQLRSQQRSPQADFQDLEDLKNLQDLQDLQNLQDSKPLRTPAVSVGQEMKASSALPLAPLAPGPPVCKPLEMLEALRRSGVLPSVPVSGSVAEPPAGRGLVSTDLPDIPGTLLLDSVPPPPLSPSAVPQESLQVPRKSSPAPSPAVQPQEVLPVADSPAVSLPEQPHSVSLPLPFAQQTVVSAPQTQMPSPISMVAELLSQQQSRLPPPGAPSAPSVTQQQIFATSASMPPSSTPTQALPGSLPVTILPPPPVSVPSFLPSQQNPLPPPSMHSAVPMQPPSAMPLPSVSIQPVPANSALPPPPPLPLPAQQTLSSSWPMLAQALQQLQALPVTGTAQQPLVRLRPPVNPPLPPGPPPSRPAIAPAPGISVPANQSSNVQNLLSSLLKQGVIGVTPTAPAPPLPPVPPPPSLLPPQLVPEPTQFTTFAPMPMFQPGVFPPPMMAMPPVVQTPLPVPVSVPLPIPAAVPQVPAPPPGHPIGRDFIQDRLQDFNPAVVESLYSGFKYQCATCAARFHEQGKYADHLDAHYQKNKRLKKQKAQSRMWCPTESEWLTGASSQPARAAPPFFAQQETDSKPKQRKPDFVVEADDDQETCALCGDRFKKFFSQEEDKWLFEGAVHMHDAAADAADEGDGAQRGPIVHAKCRSRPAPQVSRGENGGQHSTGAKRSREESSSGGGPSQDADGGGREDSKKKRVD